VLKLGHRPSIEGSDHTETSVAASDRETVAIRARLDGVDAVRHGYPETPVPRLNLKQCHAEFLVRIHGLNYQVIVRMSERQLDYSLGGWKMPDEF
jgi:hypothetical protein